MSTTRLTDGLLLVVLGLALVIPIRVIPDARGDGAKADEFRKLSDQEKAQRLEQDVTQGSLRVVQEDGTVVECPLRHTDVQAEVSGFIARVKVTQTFYNPADDKIEAVYVFPLPHEAAVDEMTMTVGQRRVVGVIKRRAEAREIYEQALAAGQTAALLEQERPNIFTQSVGNIDPAQEVKIEIHYVDVLAYDMGSYEFHFPMVVGPRFIPGAPIDVPPATPVDLQGAVSPPVPDSTRVPDASRISPPVLKPGNRNGHNISLAVRLDAGVPIQDLKVANHQAEIDQQAENRAEITLSPADAIPNKDFVLRYHVVGKKPEMAVLTHTANRVDARRLGQGYLMLMVQPQEDERLSKSPPREIVFLLDVSGSMSGQPTEKVKQSMRDMLGLCREVDTLQVITFASQTRQVFERPVPVTRENVTRALNFTANLRGGGGTHMLEGVKRAIDQPLDPERLRIVIMLTDGYIGNEAEIIQHVGEHCGDQVRFWAIGIGSSPNMFLIDGVARQGGGMGKRLGLEDHTAGLAEEVITRIQRAQLAQVQIDWGSLDVCETYPARLPELWAGRPLIVFGRYRGSGKAEIQLKGRIEGKPAAWPLQVNLPNHQARHEALASVWARKKIEDLMQQAYYADSPAVEEEVTAIALDYRLMSQYTSFVAVDEDDADAVQQGLVAQPPRRMLVPVPLPEGTRWEGFFGSGYEIREKQEMRERLSLSKGLKAPARGQIALQPLGRFFRNGRPGEPATPAPAIAAGHAMAGKGTHAPGWGAPMAGPGISVDRLTRLGSATAGVRRKLSSAAPARSSSLRARGLGNHPVAAGTAASFGLALEELAEDEDFALGDLAYAVTGDVAPVRDAAAESLKKGRAAAEGGPSHAARADLLQACFLASAAANLGDHAAAVIRDEALAELETLHSAQVQTWQKQLAPLGAKLSCVLRDVSLDEALETIAEATGLSFQVLPGSVEDARELLSGRSPRITYLDLRGIDAAQALDWLLQPMRLSWHPDSSADSMIQVGSERRFSGRSGWVYDVSLVGMPSPDQLDQGDTGQDVAAGLQAEGNAFVEAIRKSLDASDTEVVWFAPGQLLVIGDQRRHARTARLLIELADAEAHPAGIPDALHRKTVARAAERRAARDAWTARRELLDVADRHAAYSWPLLAAACGGQLDLEALTELQSAWQSDATERLLEGPGVGLALRSAWAVTRAARLLPDQPELVTLAESVRARSRAGAEHAVQTVQASPGEEAKRLAAIYACLVTGDPDLSAKVLEALTSESAEPAAWAARALLTPGSGEYDSALADLVASDPIRGEDTLVLVAIACRRAGGATWEAFRAASGQLLGSQPLAGDVVVLVSRLSGDASVLDEG